MKSTKVPLLKFATFFLTAVIGLNVLMPLTLVRVKAECPENHFCSEYFNNINLEGDPVYVTTDLGMIDYNWGLGGPENGVNTDNFSVRWIGQINFGATTNYEFSTDSDDGVRLYIDGVLLIDDWTVGSKVIGNEIELTEGFHEIKLEYFEDTDSAHVKLVWQEFVDPEPCLNEFCSEYFNNKDLAGTPLESSATPEVNFVFAYGAPIVGGPIGKNKFSIRWTGNFEFDAAKYKFLTKTDDGVRLYVDDELLFDGWGGTGLRKNKKNKVLTAGFHKITMEYREKSGWAQARLWWKKVL